MVDWHLSAEVAVQPLARHQQFLDRIDRGDAAWNDLLANPRGEVRYLLMSRNPRSGDLITTRYPNADAGTEEGLTPVFRTQRYLLVRVAAAPAPATP